MYSKDEELELISSIYDDLDSELEKIYQEQKNDKEELLKEVALLLLYYEVIENVLKIDKAESIVINQKISNKIITFINKESSNQIKITKGLINNTLDKLEGFYNYKLKDAKNIANKVIDGKTYSDRIWKNNKDISKYLRLQVNDFINGKINKEQMRRNIEKAFNTSKYNASRLVEDRSLYPDAKLIIISPERLVENTISDVRSDMFEEFCKYTGVERVTRNAVLDGATCAECKELDGETYSLDDPNRPKAKLHLKCRCFYTVES